MKFRTRGNLVIADCPVSYSKHDSTASESQQLGLSAPFQVVDPCNTSLILQTLTRLDASDNQHHLQHPNFRDIIMRIPLWTQVLRCV